MVKRLVIDVLTNGVWWRAMAFAGLVAILPPAASSADAQDVERDWTFVRQVLSTSEYGHDNSRISRWDHSPRYKLFVRFGPHREAVRKVEKEINRALRQANWRISIEENEKGQADGVIAIVPANNFDRMLHAAQCSIPSDDNAGITCVKVDRRSGAIGDVIVLIDEDLERDLFKSALLEEVFQSLGVTNDQALIEESLIFEDNESTTTWSDLAPIDKKVLIFLYKYLEPGDDEATVRRKFDAHWHEIVVE